MDATESIDEIENRLKVGAPPTSLRHAISRTRCSRPVPWTSSLQTPWQPDATHLVATINRAVTTKNVVFRNCLEKLSLLASSKQSVVRLFLVHLTVQAMCLPSLALPGGHLSCCNLQAGGLDTEQLRRQGFDARALKEAASTTNGSGSNGSKPSEQAENPQAVTNFDYVASVAPQGPESGQDAETSEDYWSPQVRLLLCGLQPGPTSLHSCQQPDWATPEPPVRHPGKAALLAGAFLGFITAQCWTQSFVATASCTARSAAYLADA